MDDLTMYFYEKGLRMEKVEAEAKNLLREHKGNLEMASREIKSDLKEFAYEIAGIRLSNVVVWGNGSVDLDFGTLVEDEEE